MQLGLRSRVALAFGLMSCAVAVVVSLSTYAVARNYLVAQRESSSLTRALLDARAVEADLANGTEPGDALAAVPSIGESQAMGRVNGVWYGGGVTVSPSDLPASLLSEAAASGAAQQRFLVQGVPFFGVAVSAQHGLYLELFPLDALDRSLRIGAWFLSFLALLALAGGILVGRWMAARLMRPVASLGSGATTIASGDLTARIEPTGDPDLDPLGQAFNEMADSVQDRINRERRFVANVSHELRSPVTAIVGTASLLEDHSATFAPRDAELVSSLASRARALSKTLVDLLELGSGPGSAPVQEEPIDVAALTERLLEERGIPLLIKGDRPIVRTDPRRVERVIGNLVDNAERHGEGLTMVTIERYADKVEIHVDDAGPGIDPVDYDRLFEPFVRGEHSGPVARSGGAGLGLAISRECADAMGGEVLVGASPEGGSRFTLVLQDGVS
ncbi:MAG: HAMP domain-containing protein [Frankiales bacterium]|nr:HAMP domain-containing protein [Frankiales bacterium]